MTKTVLDQRNDSTLPGSSLRNEAADYLGALHSNVQLEVYRHTKKVDIVCQVRTFGKVTELLVEVKDYARNLSREEVAVIAADYEPLLNKDPTSRLLLVTRGGLSPAAQASIQDRTRMFHQTIWELEDEAFGLLPYVSAQTAAFEEGGLSSYYVPARANLALYDTDHARSLDAADILLLETVELWLEEDEAPPIAILGGYGAGKSSFARQLLSRQADRAMTDPAARRPILIKLGAITRSTGLDSLLGSLFTSEYEVRGYSFRRFKEFNEKGRLLIILDGFDEMKHAMTWTEFRNEIRELNLLNKGKSKVILLGRPSAFTSDDEHLEVLRGRWRQEGGITTRLRDWPEFREYELAPFSRAERIDFVRRYLLHAACEPIENPSAEILKRIDEVNHLADLEPEVFGKPVHAFILVELALDANFDLSKFADGVTRWTLYAQFFALLARRETEKPARSPIEASARLEFLRRVALWAWEDRDGATSFRAADLPALLFDGLPEGDAETLEDKKREYLAGAFLERKANDNYFFPHRSFAEFLVAEHLALHPPLSNQHQHRALLVRDGVSEFLDVAPTNLRVADWCATLDVDSGELPIDYLLFLIDRAKGFPQAAGKLAPDSCWLPLLQILGTMPDELLARQRILSDAIMKGSIPTIALLLASLTRYHEIIPHRSDAPSEIAPLHDLTLVTAAALITRVILSLRESEASAAHTIDEKAAPVLKLAQACISLHQDEHLARSVMFSWSKLAEAAASLSDRMATQLTSSSTETAHIANASERLPYVSVRNVMPSKQSKFFHDMVLRRGSLQTIAVVGFADRRSSGRSR